MSKDAHCKSCCGTTLTLNDYMQPLTFQTWLEDAPELREVLQNSCRWEPGHLIHGIRFRDIVAINVAAHDFSIYGFGVIVFCHQMAIVSHCVSLLLGC